MKLSILVFPLGVLQKLNTQQKTVQIALHMYNIKVFPCPLITIYLSSLLVHLRNILILITLYDCFDDFEKKNLVGDCGTL